MEVSPIYGISNLVVAALFFVGMAFALTWLYKATTRAFGAAVLIALLILTQLHAVVVYLLRHSQLPFDITGLIMASIASVTLTLFLAKDVKPLFYTGYWYNLRKALAISAVAMFIWAALIKNFA